MFTSADLTAFFLTLQLAFITTLILLILGTPLAWYLARSRWRYKFILEALVCFTAGATSNSLRFLFIIIARQQWTAWLPYAINRRRTFSL